MHPIDLKERKGLEGVAAALQKERPDALTALPSTTLVALGHRIVKLAAELRIAAVYTDAEFVRAGGHLRTAKSLGLPVPAAVMFRANEVVE